MTSTPGVLFLHGGPGFTAALERRRYGASLPVHWWEQPRADVLSGDAFQALVAAAVREVRDLRARSNRRISLIANSFGARLALEVLRELPEDVEHLTVSAGVLDQREAFLRMGARLGAEKADMALLNACREARSSRSREAFWELTGRVTAQPDLLRHYFSPHAAELHAELCALAAEKPLVDDATFQAVVNAVLDSPAQPLHASPPRGVRVLLGRWDPYGLPNDAQVWKSFFPGADIEIVDAGHFPHLELPVRAWWPGWIEIL